MTAGARQGARRRGSILLLSLFFMTVLFLMGVGLFKLIPVEFQAAHRSRNDQMGHYVANAGIRHAVDWLGSQWENYENDPNQDTSLLPENSYEGYVTTQNARDPEEKTGTEDWDYQLAMNVQPGQPITLPDMYPRVFAITSTAFHRGTPVRRVDVVVRQASFASFAFYSDRFLGPTRWVIDGDVGITGPVHTNDYHRFEVADSGLWDDDAAVAYFSNEVSHSGTYSAAPTYGDGNEWLADTPYDGDGPIDGRYEKVFAGGRNALKPKDYVQLPTNTDSLLELAYGDATTPTLQGVYINEEDNNVKAGILISGKANLLEARLDQKGNQVIVIEQSDVYVGEVTKTKNTTKSVPYNPPKYVTKTKCISGHYETVDAGGGLAEPQTIWVCDQTQDYQQEQFQTIVTGTTEYTTSDFDDARVEIFEVTEAEITVDGQTALPGQTLIRRYTKDDDVSGAQWQLQEVKVLDGLPNGTIYVQRGDANGDGDFSDGDKEKADIGNLRGIIKGSAQVDPATGEIAKDADGNTIYTNKTIATDIAADGRVWLGGDLLQFDPERFAATTNLGGGVLGNPNVWKNVALDPNSTDANTGEWSPDLSADNTHALGLISRDVWMAGPTNNNTWNGNDNYNDVYAVILAGKTHTDSNGEILKDASGRPITSGGFGTEYHRRNSTSDPLGRFRIMGGIIQGTTGNNPESGSQYTHAWKSGNSGYDVQLVYDKEASRQDLFPVFPQFTIIRYAERSARS